MKYKTAEASLQVLHPTTRMIDLMEIAAARLMKPLLREAESSVAVAMNVTYAAPSLRQPSEGSRVRAVASYNGISGRLHRFTINAFDESGLIGTAEHTRAVVIERRVMSIARERAGKPGMLLMV